MMDRIVAAEEDLKACAADGSGKVESKASGEVEEKVERAKMFLGYGRDFLYGYDGVWMQVSDAGKHWLIWELEENAFVIVMFGLQIFFLGLFVCSVIPVFKKY